MFAERLIPGKPNFSKQAQTEQLIGSLWGKGANDEPIKGNLFTSSYTNELADKSPVALNDTCVFQKQTYHCHPSLAIFETALGV